MPLIIALRKSVSRLSDNIPTFLRMLECCATETLQLTDVSMQPHIHQAVILSAGFGKRVQHISDTIPKVMAPIQGKPLLLHHIEWFKRHGVKEFFINLHYKPEAIRGYFGDGSSLGVSIRYADEQPEILGTAGGVKQFEPFVNENFFMIYGDLYSEVNYSKMAEHFFAPGGPAENDAYGMELVGDTDHPQDSDLVEVDTHLKFIKIYPKPHEKLPTRYRSMRGVFILNKKILSVIPPATYYEMDHQVLPALVAGGKPFYGYEAPEDFVKDIGTPERYYQVHAHLEGQSLVL